MLYINVERVMRLRRIENPYRMLLSMGFAPATVRRILKKQVYRLDLAYLEMLCVALNCTPNDLLEWHPSEKQIGVTELALIKLKRDGEEDIAKLFGSLPMEKFGQIADIIKELKNE